LKICIKGIGVVGGFGCGIKALEQAVAGRACLPGKVAMPSSQGDIEVPALLADTAVLTNYVDKKALRRVDHYIRMALLGAHLALEDAGLLESPRPRMGIIVATGYGATCNTFDFQQSILNVADPCGSPTKFSNSVHNAAASHISILLHEMGPTLSVSHFDLSIPSAFLTALQWLSDDRVDMVLVGGVDEYCKVLGYYWHCRYGSVSGETRLASAAKARHTIIGEGACFFVLQKEAAGASPYGFIDEVQMTNYRRGPVVLPPDAVFFVGTDGYSDCETHYLDVIPRNARVAVYTPLYGGIPIGMAFDLAIAALSNRSGIFFESYDGAAIESGELNQISRNIQRANERICCLKLGAGDVSGWITLSADDDRSD
jgi:3-oxoacyl-[acyl-carrier-protein] synthase II